MVKSNIFLMKLSKLITDEGRQVRLESGRIFVYSYIIVQLSLTKFDNKPSDTLIKFPMLKTHEFPH